MPRYQLQHAGVGDFFDDAKEVLDTGVQVGQGAKTIIDVFAGGNSADPASPTNETTVDVGGDSIPVTVTDAQPPVNQQPQPEKPWIARNWWKVAVPAVAAVGIYVVATH